jgi:outer membrane protein OmpA-like peptidoglycan-associated protein
MSKMRRLDFGCRPRAVISAMKALCVFPLILAPALAALAQTPPPTRDYTNIVDVYFSSRSATVSGEKRGELAKQFRRVPSDFRGHSVCAAMMGHADSAEGDDAAHLALSIARAEAVADVLIPLGAVRSRMEVQGMGIKQPVVPLPDPRNARVEVAFYPC